MPWASGVRRGRRVQPRRSARDVSRAESTGVKNVTVPIGPGEMVIFHSDGVTAVINNLNNLFGLNRLRQTIAQAPNDAASVGQSIWKPSTVSVLGEHRGTTSRCSAWGGWWRQPSLSGSYRYSCFGTPSCARCMGKTGLSGWDSTGWLPGTSVMTKQTSAVAVHRCCCGYPPTRRGKSLVRSRENGYFGGSSQSFR